MTVRRAFLVPAAALLILTLLGNCNPGKYDPKPDEEIYGIWINDKNYNLNGFQKTVISADGWKNYTNISDSVPWELGTSQIDSKWTDSEGNIWYKTFGMATGGHAKGAKFQTLTKLSRSLTVMETVARLRLGEFDSNNYPAEIDPNDDSDAVYYRAN
jgi:hypothetical protein